MPMTQDEFSQRLAQQASRRPLARSSGPSPIQSIAEPARRPDTPAQPTDPQPDSFSARLAEAAQRSEITRSDEEHLAGATNEECQQPVERGPVGQGDREARQGECVVSIAVETGHFWDTIWNDTANTELRDVRKDPCILLPGDRVTIPPIRPKNETGQTEMRHRFRKKGQPEQFRVRVLEDDEPRRNEPYTLAVDGADPVSDVTDAEGQVVRVIAAQARKAVLTVGEGRRERRYEFALGALDPLDQLSGVQGRLNALGFDCGPIDGKMGPLTREALRDYQRSRKLRPTGQPDETTRNKLREDYGC